MTIRLCLAGLVVAVVGLVDVRAQAPQVLSALTVPTTNLPAGCALKPSETSRTLTLPDGTVRVVSIGAAPGNPPKNPWVGTDNAVRTAARRAVEGPSRAAPLPDAPPPSREEMAAWTAKGLSDIAEGYQADYTAEGEGAVRVAAVRYVEPRPATRAASGQFTLGSTVVQVTGPTSSACYRAIWRHIESLR